MKKFVLKLFLFILLIFLIILGIFLYDGYTIYKSAINTISLQDKISSIQNSDSFTSLENIPSNFINAVIAVEDHRFYEHGSVDYISLGRATISNIKSKDLVEGGSTITQQVAKNLYFMQEKDSIGRKFAELFLSNKLEKFYSKNDILELYINIIYYGDGYYCVKDAANGYFNKEPIDMNLYECTLLAGIPNAPSVYSPNVNAELSHERHKKVVRAMVEYNYLTQEQADKIWEIPNSSDK